MYLELIRGLNAGDCGSCWRLLGVWGDSGNCGYSELDVAMQGVWNRLAAKVSQKSSVDVIEFILILCNQDAFLQNN